MMMIFAEGLISWISRGAVFEYRYRTDASPAS
jgi:hypothetical protein